MQLVVNRGKAQGRLINISGPRFFIGRAPECLLRPASEEVSRLHAELEIIAGVSTWATRRGRALTGGP